jgi:NAD-dependent deacetylase
MTSDFVYKISQAASLIQEASYIVALSGAGISTPSGIPDFRSQKTGLWEKDDPMIVASLSSFLHRPMVFFNWLKPLAKEIYNAKPNSAHRSLAALEKIDKLKVIVTQNIDNLHQKAGSKHVIQVHGSMAEWECPLCKTRGVLSEKTIINFIDHFEIPTCESCQHLLKPGITLFEEMLPFEAWEAATNHFEMADLVIVIGSSLEVSPANQLPYIATSKGAKLIINTLSKTPMDQRADLLLPFDVVEVWPEILKLMNLD